MKAYAQQRYRNGPRTRVRDGNTPIPNWVADSGRTCINNKKELFSFINWQICKSGVSRTLLLNAHFFRKHISMGCLPTGIFMYQNFNRSSRLRRTPGYSCMWILKQCKFTVRHVTVCWSVRVLSWQSGFSKHSGYQSYWWAFVTERGIMTFLFTQILVGQSPSHWLCYTAYKGMGHDFPVSEDALWQEYRLYTLAQFS